MANSGLVSFMAGDAEIGGYLSHPDEKQAPGLVLIPDVRGLADHFMEVADRFAASGFATLAIDLYSREGAPQLPDVASALRWMDQLPDQRVLSDIRAAADYMTRSGLSEDRIGVTGFCMGGQYALMAASSSSEFSACVSWYGMLRYNEKTEIKPADPLDMAHELSCPYLGFFGEQDTLIPISDVEELRRVLVREGKTFEIKSYPNAGHAFFNDSRPDFYKPEAAADAWPRALSFLKSALTEDA